jgi:hypothetical protein
MTCLPADSRKRISHFVQELERRSRSGTGRMTCTDNALPEQEGNPGKEITGVTGGNN